MNTLLQMIRGKRDTRSYSAKPVDDETLAMLLGTARMAGSAKNRQPVRLLVVTDSALKKDLKAAGDFAGWIDRAPTVVVVSVAADAGPRRLFDAGRHAQNLMLAAHALGLASCPVTIHHYDVVRGLLGVPESFEPVMFVTLGWPSDAPERNPVAGPRLSLGDYAATGRWPDGW